MTQFHVCLSYDQRQQERAPTHVMHRQLQTSAKSTKTKDVIYYTYVHKDDAQRINIKWRAWPQALLAEARSPAGYEPGWL